MGYPKVLVISNNCFSTSGSNGRTLANFFYDWPKENLAQFYIQNEIPDSLVCDNYFRVTDHEAVKSIAKLKKVGSKIGFKENKENKSEVSNVVDNRNPLIFLVRNLVWNIGLWKRGGFYEWVNNFSPEIIFLQVGDSPFMIKIAIDIAKRNKIPLVVYNSEDYYFKKYNYFESKKFSFLYNIYFSYLKKSYRKLMENSKHFIYNTEMLQKNFTKKFPHDSTVIMTVSNLSSIHKYKKEKNNTYRICYLGNLGINRHKSLIEIAKTLKKIDSKIELEVYGKIPSKAVGEELNNCSEINYKGMVSYEEVKKVMSNSDVLVHVESFDEFYKKDLRHAFSTKIADCLAIGKPFIVYSPENLASTQYLQKNQAACVITEEKKLKEKIEFFLQNKDEQEKYLQNAINLAQKNHSAKKNSNLIKKIFTDSITN